jgi:two-component system chemotaxis response regulator CheY
MMFSELGHEVVQICEDGEEAIRAYPVVKPDLVTMDITMPGLGGVEATRAIKAAHADARVIMVNSHGQEAMVLCAIVAGASGYVLKPVSRDKLARPPTAPPPAIARGPDATRRPTSRPSNNASGLANAMREAVVAAPPSPLSGSGPQAVSKSPPTGVSPSAVASRCFGTSSNAGRIRA